MNQKFKFKEFSERNNPKITMPVCKEAEPKPKKKEWVVGAKFMRPEGDIGAGQIWTVSHIDGHKIYGEDGLWTARYRCTLV